MLKKSKIILLLICNILTLSLSSCFDLGDYGEIPDGADLDNVELYYEPYYETFGAIDLFKQSKSLKEYDLKDSFFNSSTINNLTWEDEDDAIPFNAYIYMGIEVEKDITLDSVSLYIKGDSDVVQQSLEIYLYIKSKDTFALVPGYSDPIYQLNEKGEEILDDNKQKKLVAYDFPDKETSIAHTSVVLNNKEFSSFTMGTFTDNVDKVKVSEGDYIILSFYNNTAYGKALSYGKISFTCLNLMVKADAD